MKRRTKRFFQEREACREEVVKLELSYILEITVIQ